jgi:hypothetical protein
MTTQTKRNSIRNTAKNQAGVSAHREGAALAPGPHWTSFEKFRVQGSSALTQIEPGAVGILTSQGRQFRILCEGDFQHLLGLAREVDRVRQGLHVVHAAVQTVQEHPGQSSVNTLVEAALLLGDSPVLPVRHRFAALQPERQAVDDQNDADEEADEVEINPKAVRRPFEETA